MSLVFVTFKKSKCICRLTPRDVPPGCDADDFALACEDDPECPNRKSPFVQKPKFDPKKHCQDFLNATGADSVHSGILASLEGSMPKGEWNRATLLHELSRMRKIIGMLETEIKAGKSVF